MREVLDNINPFHIRHNLSRSSRIEPRSVNQIHITSHSPWFQPITIENYKHELAISRKILSPAIFLWINRYYWFTTNRITFYMFDSRKFDWWLKIIPVRSGICDIPKGNCDCRGANRLVSFKASIIEINLWILERY